MKDVQTRLGHSRLSTTMDTYTHTTEEMSLETVKIFEKTIAQGGTTVENLHQNNESIWFFHFTYP